jgi:hypothetical protein
VASELVEPIQHPISGRQLAPTWSGVCFFLVAMLMSSLPAHNVGRLTSNDLDQQQR